MIQIDGEDRRVSKPGDTQLASPAATSFSSISHRKNNIADPDYVAYGRLAPCALRQCPQLSNATTVRKIRNFFNLLRGRFALLPSPFSLCAPVRRYEMYKLLISNSRIGNV